MINLDELTLGQVKELQGLSGRNEFSHPYKIGEKYFIRTVTMYYTGKLLAVYDKELVLNDVSWIADAGRLSEFLEKGIAKEVEPFPVGNVIIGRGSILDISEWGHALPRTVK